MNELFEALTQDGYQHLRVLPNGLVIGTHKMLFTTGLFVGLDRTGYRYRYCYENENDAMLAATLWDGEGDPPLLWIKRKGLGEDKLNPEWAKSHDHI